MLTTVSGALAVSVLLGVALTWAVRGLAVRMGVVNHPNPIIPQHKRPIAYLGGVAILLTVTLAAIILAGSGDEARTDTGLLLKIGIPALLFLLLGTLDDLRALPAAQKLVLQAAVSAVAVFWLRLFHSFTGVANLDMSLSFIWILLVVNAFNLTDVCDGLVGGLTVIALAFVLIVLPEPPIVVWVLIGACIGFLVFNLPHATIFLGDGGSHFLGFSVAALLLSSGQETAWPYVPQMILAVGIPLFEVFLLVTVRINRGVAWWQGSPDHLSLRLQKAGLSKWQTDITAWGGAAILCAAAVAMGAVPLSWQIALLACAALGLGLSWKLLRRYDVEVI
jgi:UDP-GlcNAc:undecaprenyl-phosphate GlcNAc-1-phosphate transferase